MVVFDHRDPGTAEDDWQRAEPWRDARPLVMREDRVVVLAAHPDDETLGAGGLLATAAAQGLDIDVIIATDDPESRRLESAAALGAVAPRAGLRFLGLPDGGLREHEDELERMLRHHLDEIPGTVLVVAPWWGDGHRDHRVLGETALRLRRPGLRVLGYPVWLWHWGGPGEVDVTGWLRLDLSPAAQERKAEAVSAHVSQVADGAPDGPMLHAGMLAHFARSVEVFVEPGAAQDRPTTPPTWFDARFEEGPDPWGFDTRWYERRKRELLLAALPAERYGRVLELGCANGSLTERLRIRADELVAIDGSPAALRRARERIPTGVRFEERTLPDDWPEGRFDLVVFSEIGFYFARDDLDRLIDHIVGSLDGHGTLLACHWRLPVSDGPLLGDDVHAALRARAELHRVVRHEEDDFLLDVFTRRA